MPTRRGSAGNFSIAVLALAALAFAGFGIQWLVHPAAMAKPLGILLTSGDATSDARAVYGGMELGFAIFLLYSTLARHRRTQGLAAAYLTLLGLGFSRLIGILLAESVSTGTLQLLATDLGGASLCFVAFMASRSEDRYRAALAAEGSRTEVVKILREESGLGAIGESGTAATGVVRRLAQKSLRFCPILIPDHTIPLTHQSAADRARRSAC